MDDQRPDTLGEDSAFPVKTPNLDSLCREGTRFNRHYVTTPICTPGRAEILTGCHSYHNGVRWFGQSVNSGLPLMPRVFQNAGYHTIHVGKWHNDGHPRDKGYNRVRRAMHDSQLPYSQYGHIMEWEENNQVFRGHSTEMFCNAAIEEIGSSPENVPWFCYVALHSPHDPFQAPVEFLPDSLNLPDNFMPVYPWDNGDLSIRDELLLPHPRKRTEVREYRRQYAGMIQHHDFHLGRLFQSLRESGNWEDTIVVFTSDHGLAVGDHGLLGKENMHEHSCRVPTVMRGPGIPAGKTHENLTHHVDFLPTLATLAGIPEPEGDGQSLFSLTTREFICCGFTSPDTDPDLPLRETQRMIVTNEWKLLWYPISGYKALYHLPSDPCESDNLLAGWRLNSYPLYQYVPPFSESSINQVCLRLASSLSLWASRNNDPMAGELTDLSRSFSS